MAEKGYEVKWEDKACSLEPGSTFLDVKKSFGWKNDVLMVGEGHEVRELRAKVAGKLFRRTSDLRRRASQVGSSPHGRAHFGAGRKADVS